MARIMMATDSRRPRMNEVAVAGTDLRYKYGLSGENLDDLIASKGMEYIEDIEKDAHLASQLATRRQKLIKKGYRIKAAEINGKTTGRTRMLADFIGDQIKHMEGSFLKDVEAMFDCIGKGFSLTEINYKYIDKGKWAGKVGLRSLRFKPAKYFSFKFDEYGHWDIVQIDPDPDGRILPRDKFIHMVAGPNDENPYGDGASPKCAFWVWVKKNEAKFWAILSERFGMPQTKIEMPANAQDSEFTKADEIIENLQTAAGIRVPKGFVVELLEARRSGEVGYDNFIERCNKEISKVAFGATLITEEGKRGQGSYALGSEHSQIGEDYVFFDAVMSAEALNEQLFRRLIDYNWDVREDEYPEIEWIGVHVDSFISFAQGVDLLVRNGFDVPKSWVRQQTGIPEARDGEAVLRSTEGGFSQSGEDAKDGRGRRSEVRNQKGEDKRSGFDESGDSVNFKSDDFDDSELEDLIERYKKRGARLFSSYRYQLADVFKKKSLK